MLAVGHRDSDVRMRRGRDRDACFIEGETLLAGEEWGRMINETVIGRGCWLRN